MPDYTDGRTRFADAFQMFVAQGDGYTIVPPTELVPIVTANIAYAYAGLSGPSSTTISVLQFEH